jgi:hypothetical protein
MQATTTPPRAPGDAAAVERSRPPALRAIDAREQEHEHMIGWTVTSLSISGMRLVWIILRFTMSSLRRMPYRPPIIGMFSRLVSSSSTVATWPVSPMLRRTLSGSRPTS